VAASSLSLLEQRLSSARELRLGAGLGDLERLGIDREEKLPLRDVGSVANVHLQDLPGHLRVERDARQGLDVSDPLE
jgi:hypothetical protein